MVREMRFALLAGAASLMPAPLVAAEALTNGGFEAPVVAGPCCITSPPTAIPGWTATPNVNVVNGTFASSPSGTNLAKQGNQYLDLVGEGGTGSISQTFTTVIGQIYNLNFWYSHNLFSGLASVGQHNPFQWQQHQSGLAILFRCVHRGRDKHHAQVRQHDRRRERRCLPGRCIGLGGARTQYLGHAHSWLRYPGRRHAPARSGDRLRLIKDLGGTAAPKGAAAFFLRSPRIYRSRREL
jgi:hypothetical protein